VDLDVERTVWARADAAVVGARAAAGRHLGGGEVVCARAGGAGRARRAAAVAEQAIGGAVGNFPWRLASRVCGV
jgi:hypothetical protein